MANCSVVSGDSIDSVDGKSSIAYLVFPKMGVPQNGWVQWNIPFKWMICGYPYFRKPLIFRKPPYKISTIHAK